MATKYTCTRCGSELAQSNFYKSYSDINKYSGRISICKECLNDLFENYFDELGDDVKALYKLCIKTDTYFDIKLFETSKEKHKETNMSLPIYYFSKVGLSQYKGRSGTDSELIDIWKDDNLEVKKVSDIKKENEISPDVVKRWGKNYTKEEYEFLEERYNSMLKCYGDKNISSTWDYQEIALNYLKIKKLRQFDDKESIANSARLMSENDKLMKSCEMKASQQKTSESDAYSDFITMIEMNEPCEKPLPFFDDIDRCEYYFKRFVRQPLSISMDMEKIEAMDEWKEYEEGESDE